MSASSLITWAILLVLVIYVVVIFNNLISLKHNVKKALANIDVLLKQRNDELPKLVDVCRAYMKHEEETLTKVIEARGLVSSAQESGNIEALGEAEGLLRGGLGKLFAVAESYPDLKADQSFLALQQRISALEDSIADRREVYNEWVNNNNVRIEQFPDLIVAHFFGFGTYKLLEFTQEELANVNIGRLFNP